MPMYEKLEPFKYQAGGAQFKTDKDNDLHCVIHFSDWDVDGYLDMFLITPRSSGSIRFYENIGTKSEHHFSDTYEYLKANEKNIILLFDC